MNQLPKIVKAIEEFRTFSLALVASGLIVFWGTFGLFCSWCVNKIYFTRKWETTIIGLTVGLSFAICGFFMTGFARRLHALSREEKQ